MIELRWVMRPGGEYGHMVEQEEVLQLRQTDGVMHHIDKNGHTTHATEHWTEWEDVPTLAEP